MCMSSPKAKTAPPLPPPEEVAIEQDPEESATSKRKRKAGTRRLQVPLSGQGEARSGLRIPTA